MKLNKINLSGVSYDIEDLNAAKTVELTQAQYDALTVKDPNTFYVITDAEPVDMSDYYTKDEVDDEITAATSGKQDTLVSGTNIKTVNNESLLGSGNIEIQGGGATYSAGTNISIDANNAINCTLPITANTNDSTTQRQWLLIGTGLNIWGTDTNGRYQVVIGRNISNPSLTEGQVAICPADSASNVNSVLSGSYPIGIGHTITSRGNGAVAIGNRANANGNNYVALGTANATGTTKMNLNNQIKVDTNNQIYIKDKTNTTEICLQDALGGTVDTELDDTSENPVQNKVIYQKFDEVEEVTAAALNALNDKIGDINTLLEGI